MSGFTSVGKEVKSYYFWKWLIILGLLLILPSGLILFAANTGSSGPIFFILVIELLFVVGVSAGFAYLQYVHLKYKVEENSLSLRRGLLSVRTTVVPFSKVTNVAFDQSFLERLFSIGTLAINQEDALVQWGPIESTMAEKLVEEISSKSHVQRLVSK